MTAAAVLAGYLSLHLIVYLHPWARWPVCGSVQPIIFQIIIIMDD